MKSRPTRGGNETSTRSAWTVPGERLEPHRARVSLPRLESRRASLVPELLFYFLIVTARAPGFCEEREYTTLKACRRLQRAHDLAPFFGVWFGQEKGVSECYAKAPAVRAVASASDRSDMVRSRARRANWMDDSGTA